MNTTNAIEIRGLVKNYPQFTLGPLDLTVPAERQPHHDSRWGIRFQDIDNLIGAR